MELTPSGRVVRSMLVVVTPSVVVSVDVPIGVPSSVKVTLPVRFAVPAFAATVAVNETASPVVDVRDDAVTDVVVGRGATVSVSGRRRGQEVGAAVVGGDDGVGCIGVVGLVAGHLRRVGRREGERLAARDGCPVVAQRHGAARSAGTGCGGRH